MGERDGRQRREEKSMQANKHPFDSSHENVCQVHSPDLNISHTSSWY